MGALLQNADTAPVRLADFLCPKIIYGRDDRHEYNTRKGNNASRRFAVVESCSPSFWRAITKQNEVFMTNSIAQFKFNSNVVRTAVINNDINFCLTDVCACLELQNPTHTANQIKEEFELPTLNVGSFDTGYGVKELTLITEPQLYFVMMRSRSAIAKTFRKWVCEEVLPAIRKTGSYSLTINKAQQGELATLIRERFEPKQLAYAWSRFNNHFKLASYKDLPASRYAEALEYARNIPLKSKNATPSDETFPKLRQLAREYFDKVKRGEVDAKLEIPDDVLAGLASFYLTTSVFSLSFDYDGNVQLWKQPDPYEELPKAIADPSNIGLKTEKITDMLNACVTALNYRAQKARRLTN